MNVLLIEDEPDFIARVKRASRDAKMVCPEDVGLTREFDEGSAIEDQLLNRLQGICDEHGIEIVLLDTDLSRLHNGITQTLCRGVFQELGIPVCRYSKKQTATESSKLLLLSRQSREGSSAVWVDNAVAQDPEQKLLPWLRAVHNGFSSLKLALDNDKSWRGTRRGPAGILARILGAPSSSADFQGYTAQNLFFFGGESSHEKDSETSRQLSTRLGYWLLNYILQFPGPILTRPAAAAFLNLTLKSFDENAVQDLVKDAKYVGPFHETQRLYWRDSIGKVIDAADGDIATHEALKHVKLERVDADNPGSSAFVCVLTQEPIATKDAAPTPDWVPSGAQLARIKTSVYDKLGPLLNI